MVRWGRHDVIYHDPEYYCAFPAAVALPGGALLVIFQRSPDRTLWGAPGRAHSDPNAQLLQTRSIDGGVTWSAPVLAHAPPRGGAEAASLQSLRDGNLFLSCYSWGLLPVEGGVQRLTEFRSPPAFGSHLLFLGGAHLQSTDGGVGWQDLPPPPQLADQIDFFPGLPVPAFGRGAMVQTPAGEIMRAVCCDRRDDVEYTALYLLVSKDGGHSWTVRSRLAADRQVAFTEGSLVIDAAGTLLCFATTGGLEGRLATIRSYDEGHTWEPWEDTGITGQGAHPLGLPDGRLMLAYAYRQEPFGIRARIVEPGQEPAAVPELILRDDGGSPALGAPWSCLTADGRALVVYYFNLADGPRHIAATWLEC